jgi:hypothetical protein
MIIIQSCANDDCLDNLFDDYKSNNECPKASIDQYSFQNKTVYLLDFESCIVDGASFVYDENCNALGVLGTIAGITKINGEEFSKAIFIKNIWKKE